MLFEIIVLGGICTHSRRINSTRLINGYIEKKANITFAIIVTSVLFALVHLFNGGMSGVSLILLVVSGTVVGILYGMTAYKFNSISQVFYAYVLEPVRLCPSQRITMTTA